MIKDNQVICTRCGLVDDYKTEDSGPHIKAICNGCDRYIQFLPKNFLNRRDPGSKDHINIMADKIIKMSLDVTKLNKEWFFHGKNGIYAGVTLLYNEAQDQYQNNGMVVQDVPREIYEKEKSLPANQKTKGNILGNAREFAKGGGSNESYFSKESPAPISEKQSNSAQPIAKQQGETADEDLPF